jgi:type I restriction enzyme S subunit
MEVKPGYKQTEVGVIPENWEVRPLSEVADFLDGQRRPVKDTDRAKMRGSIPYYGASGVVDYVNGHLFDEDLICLARMAKTFLAAIVGLHSRSPGRLG